MGADSAAALKDGRRAVYRLAQALWTRQWQDFGNEANCMDVENSFTERVGGRELEIKESMYQTKWKS